MNNIAATTKRIALVVGDFLILEISLIFSLLIRYRIFNFTPEIWYQHLIPFTIAYLGWIIIFFINNLYELRNATNHPTFYQEIVRAYIEAAIITIAFFYLFIPAAIIAPKTNLFINLAVSFGLFYLWRNLFNKTLKSNRLQSNIAIIGINPESLNLAKQIITNPQIGYRLITIIDEYQCQDKGLQLPDNIRCRDDIKNLKNIIKQEKIETLVINSDIHKAEDLQKILLTCLPLKINIVDLPAFYENITGKIPLKAIGQMWFLENIISHNKTIYDFFKRISDLLIGTIILIPSIVVMPCVALAIKLTSPGPILFKQKRTGKNGETFLAVKFRSMYIDAEKHGPQWAQKNDPRITSIGRILRKSRLDEIPQLFNIIRGEMSFVGPRPERPEFIEDLEKEIPFYRQRLLVKPGLTGWAQVEGPSYGGSKKETLEKLQYDLYYIKNYSFFLDLGIILKTINIVLKFKGQ